MRDCHTCGWTFSSGRALCKCEGGPLSGKRFDPSKPFVDPEKDLREREMLVLLGIDEERYI